jgi:rare lipoprotein A
MRFSASNPHIAAHKYLPFGEEYLLTNHKNGRTLCVSIEDRGPFVAGRDLDLTKAGAKVLGFEEAGTATLQAVKADCL